MPRRMHVEVALVAKARVSQSPTGPDWRCRPSMCQQLQHRQIRKQVRTLKQWHKSRRISGRKRVVEGTAGATTPPQPLSHVDVDVWRITLSPPPDHPQINIKYQALWDVSKLCWW